MDNSADAVIKYGADNLIGFGHIKYHQRHVIVAAHHHGSRVHHIQIVSKHLTIAEVIVFYRIIKTFRVLGIDAIDLRRLEHCVHFQLDCAQTGGAVGGLPVPAAQITTLPFSK